MIDTRVAGERRRDLQKRSDFPMLHEAGIEVPNDLDRMLHAMMGQFTQGISPTSLALAWCDWAMHLAQSPGKWQELVRKADRKSVV